jgi:hypothetical protein
MKHLDCAQNTGATRQRIWDLNEEEGVVKKVLEGVPEPWTLSV